MAAMPTGFGEWPGNVDSFRIESRLGGPIRNLHNHVPPSHLIAKQYKVTYPESRSQLLKEMAHTPGLLSPTPKALALARGPGIMSELHHPPSGLLPLELLAALSPGFLWDKNSTNP